MNALAARTALSALYAASTSTFEAATGLHDATAAAWTTAATAAVANATAADAAPVVDAEQPRFTLSQTALIALVSGMLSFITVSGNIMVMVSFKIDKQLQNISNYFLFSLALADFFIGLISMPLFTVYTILGYWPFGRHVCDGWLALDYLASNASVLNLLLISFDRYLSVTRPLTYRAKRTKVKALMFICKPELYFTRVTYELMLFERAETRIQNGLNALKITYRVCAINYSQKKPKPLKNISINCIVLCSYTGNRYVLEFD